MSSIRSDGMDYGYIFIFIILKLKYSVKYPIINYSNAGLRKQRKIHTQSWIGNRIQNGFRYRILITINGRIYWMKKRNILIYVQKVRTIKFCIIFYIFLKVASNRLTLLILDCRQNQSKSWTWFLLIQESPEVYYVTFGS